MIAILKRWRSGQRAAPVETGFLSDPGCHREANEDAVCILRRPGGGVLAAVADGMGGHQSGEIASRLAIEVIGRVYSQSGGLVSAFEQANRAVWKLSQERPDYGGMGTTCTALALDGALAQAAHVGDSRLYLVRAGHIFQMTEDHSLVMDMVRKGLLTVEEASRHEDRNVIVRALGTKAEVEVSTWSEPFPVRAGDRFVLCSDGLYDLVADPEIQNVVEAVEPQAACRILVRAARERGGYDNITVAVVRLGPELPAEGAAARETRESEIAI